MANEINFTDTSGQTLYAIVKTAAGQFVNGTTPEAFTSGHWTNYAITLTEIASSNGRYQGNFPALPAGVYAVEVYRQIGGSPALTDGLPAHEGEMQWSGTAEVARAALLPPSGMALFGSVASSPAPAANAFTINLSAAIDAGMVAANLAGLYVTFLGGKNQTEPQKIATATITNTTTLALTFTTAFASVPAAGDQVMISG